MIYEPLELHYNVIFHEVLIYIHFDYFYYIKL